jgi:hypothetical protein
VMLVYYDDQSNPSTVPGLYTKLLDADKADRVISGYVTHMVAPAMPGVMQHRRVFLGLPALAPNSEFDCPSYFLTSPTGGAAALSAEAGGLHAQPHIQDGRRRHQIRCETIRLPWGSTPASSAGWGSLRWHRPHIR